MIITGEANINMVRILTLRSALRLEVIGMSRRGRSVYSIVKEEFKLKGSKKKVYDQFNEIVTKAQDERDMKAGGEFPIAR